jgi:hypothetical protein
MVDSDGTDDHTGLQVLDDRGSLGICFARRQNVVRVPVHRNTLTYDLKTQDVCCHTIQTEQQHYRTAPRRCTPLPLEESGNNHQAILRSIKLNANTASHSAEWYEKSCSSESVCTCRVRFLSPQ